MPSAPAVSWYRLILHPADPLAVPAAPEALCETLTALGLVGEPFRYRGDNYFLPGARFLELVVFLGCSPVIELERQDDAAGEPQMTRFCHVRVPPVLAEPGLDLGDPAAAPRCPHCRAPVPDWRERLSHWRARPLAPLWQCPGCGQTASAAQINWRQAGAVVRSRIELAGIHPYEAVPADEFLTGLEQATGQPWKHYYARP